MSFSFIDRNKILQDEKANRLKKIALIERENAEMLPLWQEKQAKLFPQAIQLSQIPTLQDVLTEETQKNAMNEDILIQRAESKISQIASKPIVQYILDRLEIQDLFYVVNQWNAIEKKLREEYSTKGLDKDILISLIKDGSGKMLQPINPNVITSRGQVRQQQKEEELKQIQDMATDRELELQKQKAELDQLADTNQTEREKQELLQKQKDEEQRKQQEALNVISKKFKKKLVVKPQSTSAQQPPASVPPTPSAPPSKYASITDDPFKYDPTNQQLDPQFEAVFQNEFNNATQQLKKLSKDEIEEQYIFFDTKFPNKFGSITGLMNDEQKIMKFVGRLIFDEVYTLQVEEEKRQKKIQSNLSLFNQAKTPRKSLNLSPYDLKKKDLVKMSKQDLVDLYFQQTSKNLPKGTLKTDIVDRLLIEEFGMKEHAIRTTGNGLSNRIIFGRGFDTPIEVRKRKNATSKKIINGKYIDLNKLKDNIICIRYCSTSALIPTVKVQSISKDVKGIIEDIINDKFEKRLFEKLDLNEKRLIKRIASALNIDIDVKDNSDDEFMKQFQVILGQFRAGNNNIAIKRKLREYISEANEAGILPRRESQKLIFELANSD